MWSSSFREFCYEYLFPPNILKALFCCSVSCSPLSLSWEMVWGVIFVVCLHTPQLYGYSPHTLQMCSETLSCGTWYMMLFPFQIIPVGVKYLKSPPPIWVGIIVECNKNCMSLFLKLKQMKSVFTEWIYWRIEWSFPEKKEWCLISCLQKATHLCNLRNKTFQSYAESLLTVWVILVGEGSFCSRLCSRKPDPFLPSSFGILVCDSLGQRHATLYGMILFLKRKIKNRSMRRLNFNFS